MTALLPRPCLCLVTDRRRLAPDARTDRDAVAALERQLDEAIDAGIDLIQVREPDLDAALACAVVARIVARAGNRTRVVVNDRTDVARAAGAAGVHLKADAPSIGRVRSIGPAGWIVGQSVHSTDETTSASGADYLIFGTVYASTSKPSGAPIAGVAGLREACEAAAPAVLAIGGVTPARVAACRGAGAAGIAAIGIFLPKGRTDEALGAGAAVGELRHAWAVLQ